MSAPSRPSLAFRGAATPARQEVHVKNTFIQFDAPAPRPGRSASCPPWGGIEGTASWEGATQALCHAMALGPGVTARGMAILPSYSPPKGSAGSTPTTDSVATGSAGSSESAPPGAAAPAAALLAEAPWQQDMRAMWAGGPGYSQDPATTRTKEFEMGVEDESRLGVVQRLIDRPGECLKQIVELGAKVWVCGKGASSSPEGPRREGCAGTLKVCVSAAAGPGFETAVALVEELISSVRAECTQSHGHEGKRAAVPGAMLSE